MLPIISTLAVFAASVAGLTAVLVRNEWGFIDFQIQIGSWIWGKRLGVKRRSGSVTSG